MKNNLDDYIKNISDLNKSYKNQMEKYLDGLTKPVGSLGRLEQMVIQLAGIQETQFPKTTPRVTVIMCADNGVCNQGISSCPQEVTATVTQNFTKGITAMNKLSHFTNADLCIVDIGVKGIINNENIISCKIREGTADFSKEYAMEKNDVLNAIEVGIKQTEKLIKKGYKMIGTGEMGIGNTTTSAAVTTALLNLKPHQVVGRGAGADERVYQSKIKTITNALDKHKPIVDNPLDVLMKVGGLDLCGLVGVFLACAKNKCSVVIDGFISATAALVAYRLCNETKHYMIASHLSEEKGMQKIIEEIGLKPHFNLEMRLGEGSGCPLLFQLADVAVYTLMGMGTFEDAGVDSTNYMNIWKK
ncbi:MAG: nicotinate-nucleotide--dimethylbenzimidazole phosphoribosyltransferase [Cellulosilyticaceae bacterium]